jgi:hypothetical protein
MLKKRRKRTYEMSMTVILNPAERRYMKVNNYILYNGGRTGKWNILFYLN